jgi:hypothetical protein
MDNRFLSTLTTEDLRQESWLSPFGKWSSLCRLRQLGLLTLDALIIEPVAEAGTAAAVRAFASHCGAGAVMVRSDGGPEVGDYYDGGSSHTPDDSITLAHRLLAAGRAVILMEPTDRTSNRLTVNTTIQRDLVGPGGRLELEFLGHGYDASDLKRGNLKPQLVVSGRIGDLANAQEVPLEGLSPVWFLDEVVEKQRCELRRRRLAELVGGESRHTELSPPDPSDDIIALLASNARRITSAYPGMWRCLSASCSLLDDGRLVYWEIADGATKWKLR